MTVNWGTGVSTSGTVDWGSEVKPAPMERSFGRSVLDTLSGVGDYALEGIDTTLALGGAPIAWMTGQLGKFGSIANQLAYNSLVDTAIQESIRRGDEPEVTAAIESSKYQGGQEGIVERGREFEEEVAGKFYQPRTEGGIAATELVGEAIETPLHAIKTLANVEGDLYESLGIENLEKNYPVFAEAAGFGVEIGAFGVAHAVGKGLPKGFRAIIDKPGFWKSAADGIKGASKGVSNRLKGYGRRRDTGKTGIEEIEGLIKDIEALDVPKEKVASFRDFQDKALAALEADRMRTNAEQKVAVEKQRALQRELDKGPVEDVEVKAVDRRSPERSDIKSEELIDDLRGKGYTKDDISEMSTDLAYRINRLPEQRPATFEEAKTLELDAPFDPKSIKAEVTDLASKSRGVAQKEFEGLAKRRLEIYQEHEMLAARDAGAALKPKEKGDLRRVPREIVEELDSINARIKELYDYDRTLIEAREPLLQPGDEIGVEDIVPDLKVIEGGKETLPTFPNINEATLGNFEVRTNRSFKTQEAAQNFLKKISEREQKGETTKGVEPGISLEVVKVKGKYRLAEAIDIVGEELEFRKLFPDKTTAEARAMFEEMKVEKPGEGFFDLDTPEKLSARLDELKDPAVEWLKNPEGKIIDPIETEIKALGNELHKDHPQQRNVDNMLRAINDKKAELGIEEKVAPDATGRSVTPEEITIEYNKLTPEEIAKLDPNQKVTATMEDLYGKEVEISPKIDAALKEFAWTKEPVQDFKAIAELLKDERGSFSIEQLPKEKLDAMRRIVKEAGKDLIGFLRSKGFSDEQAQVFLEAARQLKPETTEVVEVRKASNSLFGPDVGAENFKVGVNTRRGKPRKYTVNKKEYIVKQTPVWEGEKAVVEGLVELPRTAGGFSLENPIRTFEKIDPTGRAKEMIYRDYQAREKAAIQWWKVEAKSLKELKKGTTRNMRRDVGKFWMNEQRKGAELLEATGVKKADIPVKLEGKALEFYNNLRERFNNFWDLTNEARVEFGKRPMRYVDNYLTFQHSLTLAEKLGIKTNPVLERMSVINEMAQAKTTGFRFAKARNKLGLYAVELDPLTIYSRYAESSIRHITMSPLVSKVAAFREPLFDPKTGKRFMLKNKHHNTSEFLRRWSNSIAGIEEYNVPKILGRGMRALNRNLTFAVLSANLRSAMIQPSALRNTYAVIGERYLAEGIINNLNPEARRFAFKESNVLETAVYDQAINEIFRSSTGIGALGKVQRGAGRAGLSLLKVLDYEARVATWTGGYKFAKANGMNKRQAINFADDLVTRTQASGLIGDVSPIQRHTLGKFLTLFQTFTINDFGFLTQDVLGISRGGMTKANYARAVRYIIATMAFNSMFEDVLGIKSPFPTPVRALIESMEDGDNIARTLVNIGMEAVEIVPPFGGAAKFGSPPLGPAAQLAGEVFEKFTDDPMQKSGWELAGKVAGVTMTAQISKSLRAKRHGESLWGQLVGTYTKKKPARRKRGGSGLGGGLKGF